MFGVVLALVEVVMAEACAFGTRVCAWWCDVARGLQCECAVRGCGYVCMCVAEGVNAHVRWASGCISVWMRGKWVGVGEYPVPRGSHASLSAYVEKSGHSETTQLVLREEWNQANVQANPAKRSPGPLCGKRVRACGSRSRTQCRVICAKGVISAEYLPYMRLFVRGLT
jgi:hypothetical protein